ncbi:MAG: OprO/OprP family phosphate-selective porin [Alphaproteobacteria bacterium]
MNKYYAGLAVMATGAFIGTASAQDYGAQIDALQNEVLKMKQKMSKGDGKGKAYFEKGKGLRVKSIDGKYKFQIKGRIMYDVGGILDYDGTLADGSTGTITEAGLGSEFRRLRFTLKGDIGNGWGFAFQPDFADGGDDSADRTVIFKDALIYKGIKGFGKLTFGNQKAAAGLYENTSSNNLIFMERPMHNETMNFGHRAGIGYDTSGAFGKRFHLKATLFHGMESAIEQNISDGSGGPTNTERNNESFGGSVATQYQLLKSKNEHIFGKGTSLLIGAHFGALDLSNTDTDTAGDRNGFGRYDTNSARANGLHTLVDKPIDLGDELNLKYHHFFGPQYSLIMGQLFSQAEYQVGKYEYSAPNTVNAVAEEDFDFHGGSISIAYAFSGNFKHSGKKGALGGLKCKRHCFMPKYQYEWVDQTDHDGNAAGTGDRNGGSGEAHTFGFNHYFNSNVRLMMEYTYGDYGSDNSNGMRSSEMSSIQTRLHLKY